jgi:hypothetical protein
MGAVVGLQQIGFLWFTFYRARGETKPHAIETAVIFATFLALALPGLALWGAGGFVWGRLAGVAIALGVRRWYVKRLLPGVELIALGARALLPVAVGAAAAYGLRLALWGGDRNAAQAVAEIVLFVGVTGAVAWAFERPLLAEARDYVRRRREAPGAPLPDPLVT